MSVRNRCRHEAVRDMLVRDAQWRMRMSTWHWIMRGCTTDDLRPTCATCGYGLSGQGSAGTCPECGVPFIAATVQHRGPMPSVLWRLGWTIVPILVSLAGWFAIALTDGAPTVMACVGLVLIVVCLLHQTVLRQFIHHMLSDLERRRIDVWCVVALWTVVSAINGLAAVVLSPLGVLLMFRW